MDYGLVDKAPSVEDHIRVRGAAGLRTKNLEAVEIALSNSLYAVCAKSGDEVVGFGRVIGDGGIFFEIVDVAVLPEHQGKGLGDAIMEAVMYYLHENAPPGSFVGLFAGDGMAGFYERHGFQVRRGEAPGMYAVIE